MTEWIAHDMKMMRDGTDVICAMFYMSRINPRSGKPSTKYRIHVHADGTWDSFGIKGSVWRTTHGVTDEAEPVFYNALPKAQALAILKG